MKDTETPVAPTNDNSRHGGNTDAFHASRDRVSRDVAVSPETTGDKLMITDLATVLLRRKGGEALVCKTKQSVRCSKRRAKCWLVTPNLAS